jgi:CubicO group peptidase (beta-lactamase class C family)
MLASARDWARFGLLFLNDGVVGGERLLPDGWVDYSARLTPHSERFGYGAGFWTNRADNGGARYRIGTGMPRDSFMARGAFGQYVAIVPSQRLVVVRLGMSFADRDDVETVGRLIADVATLSAHKGE